MVASSSDFFFDKAFHRGKCVVQLADVVAAAHGGIGLAAALAAGNGGDVLVNLLI